jgi:transposase-like protein
MVTLIVSCRYCGNQDAVRRKGLTTNGNQPHRRTGYKCEYCKRSLQQVYTHKAHEPGIKERVVDMPLNGSGIRDTARVLKINMNTVMSTLKKGHSNRLS